MAASCSHNLQLDRRSLSLPPELRCPLIPCLALSVGPLSTRRKLGVFRSSVKQGRSRVFSVACLGRLSSRIDDKVEVREEVERPPFDLNLAVILAGFAFEAYYTPPDNVGRHELDAAGCKTVYLAESFIREIYDGILFIKLKKGLNLPAMDPWGTSDPYVVMQFGGQVVKSKTKWGNKEPTWNEEFSLNIKQPPEEMLQVAAWDANLVTPPKRMGNAGVNLEGLCDGALHDVQVELEGMGGGGKIQLEKMRILCPRAELEERKFNSLNDKDRALCESIRYKSFEEIDDDKKWWKLPFVSDFLRKNGFESAVKRLVGSETVQVREFLQFAFAQLDSFNDAYVSQEKLPKILKQAISDEKEAGSPSDDVDLSLGPDDSEGSSEDAMSNDAGPTQQSQKSSSSANDGSSISMVNQNDSSTESDQHFWRNFADLINQNVVKNLGIPVPEKMRWEGFDVLNKIGLQLKTDAEAGYVESGLAAPVSQDDDKTPESGPVNIGIINSSLPAVKKATEDVLRQTDSIFGALMLLAASVPQLKKESADKGNGVGVSAKVDDDGPDPLRNDVLAGLDDQRAEEMKALFSTAESAMEAWTMLATSLGHPSFIKSEFEKICFLDNSSTDTQVAIWRDLARKRLVIAFRGTEQAKWKDLMTDLMLAPAGLNPERIGGDFKQEVQVHSGFLGAYDSVRTRIMSLVRQAIDYKDDAAGARDRWHIFTTGHSLGGALATLLALELSSSQMAKHGAVSVTMYNFGSPRVGNRQFAEVYNKKVKDSWRVVNHRDIIPTVPRLMGYCHVAQPVYLAPGDEQNSSENFELLNDGYQGDVIGESTPDVLVSEFMKGEKELVEKLLQTEINIFRSIRDGSALMQHMEDFYYIMLLENVKSKYRTYPLAQDQTEEASVA